VPAVAVLVRSASPTDAAAPVRSAFLVAAFRHTGQDALPIHRAGQPTGTGPTTATAAIRTALSTLAVGYALGHAFPIETAFVLGTSTVLGAVAAVFTQRFLAEPITTVVYLLAFPVHTYRIQRTRTVRVTGRAVLPSLGTAFPVPTGVLIHAFPIRALCANRTLPTTAPASVVTAFSILALWRTTLALNTDLVAVASAVLGTEFTVFPVAAFPVPAEW